MNFRRLRAGLIRFVVLAVATVAALSARAGVLSSPVTVMLNSPGGYTDGIGTDSTPISLSDTVATNLGIHPGDGSQIGGFMLSSEFISFGGASNDISLRVAAGADTGGVLTSGYLSLPGNHALYEFTGLDIANEIITGFSVLATGLQSPILATDYVHLLSAHSLSIDLDTLIFAANPAGASLAGVDLVIDLQTCIVGQANCGGVVPPNPVPEPVSLALVLGALAILVAGQRRWRVATIR
jgi:hypothetical protein